MRKETIGNCELYLGDCMEYMAGLPDKAFDLAIVDPPYGINIAKKISGSGSTKTINGKSITIKNWKFAKPEPWDKSPPTADYFQELFRSSKYQIIWGGNYFMDKIKRPSKCWIGLVKGYIPDAFTLSNIEFAYTNLNGSSKYFRQGNKVGNCGSVRTQEVRYHPCQKPVDLYKWLLQKYAKPGWRILDTHGGSFSSAVAAYDMGFDYTGIELDEEYYKKAVSRMRAHTAQGRLFDTVEAG